MSFTDHRAHLVGVGYRLTGSRADAEDAVQEAWLRWDRMTDEARAAVRDERAWLATTVARLCLDQVRSAPARREHYVGPWLPEPLVTTADGDGPLEQLVRDEDVRLAALLVLERLSPDQRVAFVVHDSAGVGFDEIAGVLGCSTAAARQHASRARRVVARDDAVAARVPAAEHRRVLDAFVAALAAGDVNALVAVLHPEVALRSDGGGVVRAARRVVHGADKVARLLTALVAQNWSAGAYPVVVNGQPGLVVPTEQAQVVVALTVRDGRASEIHLMLNPEKYHR